MPQHILTPRFILQQQAAGKQNGRLQAATLFVDISGFTAVTEALMQHGKVGAETLADVMQTIFTPLIAAVYERGGFITGFAGDAFTAVFPGRGVQAMARAVDAAWVMRGVLADSPNYATQFGTFSFTGRVGVAAGAVNWGVLRHGSRRTAYFRGRAIDLCAEAEHHGADGQVVLADNVAAALSGFLTTVPLGGAFRQLTGITGTLPLGRPFLFDQAVAAETAAAFHPEALLQMSVKGEFRQVVSVFLNLRGNPRPAALAQFMQLCFALLGQYEGYLCRLDFGDKGCNLLLFWGAPTSHENDIERALNFLLDLQADAQLPVRAGVTYRQAFAGFAGAPLREEYTCYGLSINQSARQMMAAPWGAVWLDGETARRAELFEVAAVGAFPFKGFAAEQPIFQLTGRREAAATFFRGLFVGRQVEMRRLAEALQPLGNGRFAGVTLVSGEAGIGKSRLVHEFTVGEWGTAADIQIFICQTDEILRRPLNPFRYWLRRYLGQSAAEDEAANKDAFFLQLAGLITATADAGLQAEIDRTQSFLGALVDLYWPDSLYEQLEPSLRFENTLRALKTLLQAESQRRPVILLVEDAQWLDEESRQFLQQLPRNIDDFPLAVLLTSREAGVEGMFDAETAVTHIALRGLDEQMIVQAAQDLLGGSPDAGLVALLQARAEGNPFFLEQLVLYLQEQGMVQETATGFSVTAKSELLPQDVQAVLVARLDRLTHAVRNVVQTAAVLGREFEVQVLSQMLRGEGDVTERVAQAEDAAIWSALTDLTYLFRHALLRDAAYQMQLQQRLSDLHRLAAEAMRQVYAADLSSHYVDLAYHYRLAGDVGQERAFALLASEQAADQYANEEALGLIERVIELTDAADVWGRFDLLERREKLLSVLGARERQQENLQTMAALAEQIENSQLKVAKQTAVLLLEARLADITGDYEKAIRLAQTAVSLAETLADTHQLTDALVAWSITLWHQGSYDAARPLLLRAAGLAEQGQFRDLEADSNNTLGLISMYQSYYDDAATYFQRALAGYRELGNRRGEALAINSLGILAREIGDQPEMRARFEEALQIFREIGLRWGESGMLNNLGLIQYDQGAYVQAYRHFGDALLNCREIGNRQMVALTLSNMGLCATHLGDFATAVPHFAAALEVAESLGDRQVSALALENWATLLIETGEYEQARAYAARGVALTREIGKRDSECSVILILGSALTALGRYEEAEQQFAAALALGQEVGVDYLEIEVLVERINLWLKSGDLARAQADMRRVLDFMAAQGTDSLDDSLRAYAVCLDVLAAVGDGALTAVAATAYDHLQACAGKIEDGVQRTRFLNQVSSHKRILDYYEGG